MPLSSAASLGFKVNADAYSQDNRALAQLNLEYRIRHVAIKMADSDSKWRVFVPVSVVYSEISGLQMRPTCFLDGGSGFMLKSG